MSETREGWKPSIPTTFWADEAVKLVRDTGEILSKWCSDRAREGNYEDATTLAVLSSVILSYVDDGKFDEDFEMECERRWERNQERLMEDG